MEQRNNPISKIKEKPAEFNENIKNGHLNLDEEITKIEEEIRILIEEITKLEKEEENLEKKDISSFENITETKEDQTEKIEKLVEDTIVEIEEKNEEIIQEKLEKLGVKSKFSIKGKISNILKKIPTPLKHWYSKYVVLPIGVLSMIALSYNSPQEYYEMFQNWKERHIEKSNVDDPSIKGIDTLDNIIEKATYDFLGKDKIDYKSGYYMTSVFDLSDKTPPRFNLINDRENYSQIDSAAGITGSFFEPFYKFDSFKPKLKGHINKQGEEIGEIPVVGYNPNTKTIRAGHYKEFNKDWLVSETYEIPLNFKLNADNTINLTYPHSTMRMTPITTNEKGIEIPFPIGITKDQTIKKFDPHKANHFGVLEGGKVIMVCGERQVQVNGSFADMFCVYERLQKEYKGIPIQAYLLDNGSYNLPIWNKDEILTKKEIREHLMRHRGGGTGLVLINDEKISPYEYKSKYKEFQHYTPNFNLDSLTLKPTKNEKSVIVLHHTGNYKDPNQIIREFEGQKEVSSHVLIFKDGTRHLFGNDNSVLGHAGKSDFNNKNKVNFFSLGIELEGDSRNGHQFTNAQLESMLEYIRPRIEKYNIPFENITTHKIIRENYIKKHPKEKGVLPKTDLDDKVWDQIKILLQKKLYKDKKGLVKINNDVSKMLGTLAYQDNYRITKNPTSALYEVKTILSDFNFSNNEVKETISFIKDNT